MRALLLVSASVLVLAACKDKSKPVAKVEPAALDAAVAPPPDMKLLPRAAPVEVATDDDCQATGDYFKPGLRAAAVDRQVAAAKLDAAADGLHAVFLQLCREDEWPAGVLDCVGKNPTDLDTYRRCFERLPTAKRNAWFVKLDEVMTTVGGQTQAVPPAPDAKGEPFEVVCATFVNELARLDDCAGSGMYVPTLEEVFVMRRQLEYGGLIPPDQRNTMAQLCGRRADDARQVASENCGRLFQQTP